jgi:hypothetical protein
VGILRVASKPVGPVCWLSSHSGHTHMRFWLHFMVTNRDVGPLVCLFLHGCLRFGSTDLLPTGHVNTCKLSCVFAYMLVIWPHVQAAMRNAAG